MISFDVLRLNEVTKSDKSCGEVTSGATNKLVICGCLLNASNKSRQSQITKQPYC